LVTLKKYSNSNWNSQNIQIALFEEMKNQNKYTHCSFNKADVLILFNPVHRDLLQLGHVVIVENSVISTLTGLPFLPGEND